MSLTDAFNIIGSAFSTNAAQTAVIARNIANQGVVGYSRETANISASPYSGAQVTSVTRAADAALSEQALTSTASAASQQALATGLSALAQTVNDSASASSASGATANGNSPSAMLANLQNALQTYQASPNSGSTAQAVVSAAGQLASSLNSASATVQQVRTQADSQMGAAVTSINSLLTQFQQANSAVIAATPSGTNLAAAQDNRDSLLSQLSKQIGVSTITDPSGSMSIYTDSGVTLFQGNTPQQLAFTPTSPLTAGASGGTVTVNGVPITGPATPMAIQSGALAGLAQLRDTVAPQYQNQLDQIAGGLVQAFSESDQTGASNPTLPGLFTFPGATGVPALNGAPAGLAGQIQVNPLVDATQGGNPNLLRDGGINGAAYVYNSTGAASYTGRIQQLVAQIGTPQSFDPGAGIGTNLSLSDYSNASVSWLQGQNQQASSQANYQNALASQASTALSNATGVNLDTELTNMLTIENSYTTTAKLLSTANAMFSALLSGIQ